MGACSGGDLLPLDGPVGRRLRYVRVIGDLRHVHEAVGQVVRFRCRGGGRSLASPPRHSRGLPHHYPMFPMAPGTRRVASGGCRLSWDGPTASRLASGVLGSHLAPRKSRLLDGQAGMYLLGDVRAKPDEMLGHAKAR